MIRDGETLNGIQLSVDIEKSVVVLKVFIDGKYTSWIEFGDGQMQHLLDEVERSMFALQDVLEAKGERE